jgi:putative colanic acid biosynthesis UDP-glucose lipid carrier transferase
MALEYLSVLVLATGLTLILLPASGAYRHWRNERYWQNTANALPALLLVSALLILIGALSKTTANFSRLWMTYWFVCAVTAMFVFRRICSSVGMYLHSSQARATKVLVIGEGDFAQSVAQRAQDAQDEHWEIVGVVSPFIAGGPEEKEGGTVVSLDAMEALASDASNGIEEVWIAMDSTALKQQEAVIRVLQTSSLTVRYVPDLSVLALLKHVPSKVAGMTVIDLNASPLTGHSVLIKSFIDKLLSLATLVLLFPLFIVIALAIKLDSPGPVFFRQKRHGWDGKIIRIFKFRTMHHVSSDNQSTRQAKRHDPRITRVGRFLRQSSIDELPQFINVLLGTMSIVGPRPHPLDLNYSYARQIDAYMQRHRVKPGITGWAQIHGLRGETDTLDKMQQRIDHDLFYIEHWSLWLDIRIMTLTLFKGWTSDNAY